MPPLTPSKPLDTIHLVWIALKHLVCFLVFGAAYAVAQSSDPAPHAATLNKYCVTCHNEKPASADSRCRAIDLNAPEHNAETWEKVIRKLRVGAMPPQGMPRPDSATLDGLATYLETSLDRAAPQSPTPDAPPCIA